MGFKSTKKMTSQRECFEALLSGKVLTDGNWKVWFNEGQQLVAQSTDEKVGSCPAAFGFSAYKDWSLYQEPKPALYLWAWQNAKDKCWYITDVYYASAGDVQTDVGALETKRLDWSKLEID